MNRLNHLTMGQKQLLLKTFIVTFAAINILVFISIYEGLKPKKQNSEAYQQNLKLYIQEYNKQEKDFERYSFYTKYDNIVLKDKQINSAYVKDINQFANITQQQFYSVYDIVRRLTISKKFGQIAKFGYNFTDWTNKRAVIRDQRGYNSSFIFSALTAIEYQLENLSKNNESQQSKQWITLSAQQIIDCCPQCLKSQRPEAVFEYIRMNGVHTQKQYPYQNSRFDNQPKKCKRQQKSGKKYYIDNYKQIKNCQALQKQIANSPVVVGVDGRNFPEYQYSIFSDCQRKTTHYATLIGISFDNWKLQNSWGVKWGERGYIRIGPGDTCGVCLRGSVPIIKLK